mmetsp:Transcript_1765/g.6341  ORF Transcript_1765/g.6341 Transcript_1765/m.6341 type:complete len:287 (+) Transcript_1765:192-1052(+)
MSVTVCNRRVRSATSIGDCIPRTWGNSSDEEGSGAEGEGSGAPGARLGSFDSGDMPKVSDSSGSEAGISGYEGAHGGCVKGLPSMAMGHMWRSCENVSQSVRSMSSSLGDSDRGDDLHLTMELPDDGSRDLAPDVPLIYCSCISVVLLMYFIVFVDCRDMARALNPELHTWHGLETLNTGFSVGASILLGFFVWLLHALLYDVAGMITGVLPAFVTFATTFSYRLYEPLVGELVLAGGAIGVGLLLARRLDGYNRRRRKEIVYGGGGILPTKGVQWGAPGSSSMVR